jgi:hypothetical protein
VREFFPNADDLIIEQIAFAAFGVNPDVSEELIAQGIRETAKRGQHSPALWLQTIPPWISEYHKRAPIPIEPPHKPAVLTATTPVL